MNIASRFFSVVTAALALTLGACGGDGGGSSPGGQQPVPVVGPAGGTVNGPEGAKAVVPPGALPVETAIAIERTSAGAPALPAGFTASGPTFAFTPHGTTFAVPVTITLPFDPASVPTGRAPVLYKTNAGNSQWEEVPNATFDGNTVTAQISGFSFVRAATPGLTRNDPARAWQFELIPGNGGHGTVVPGPEGSGTQVGGLLEQVVRNLGPAVLDRPIRTTTQGTFLVDRAAGGMISSTPDGSTYGVFVEAPFNPKGGREPIGAVARLEQSQSFVKRSTNASLTYTVSTILIDATDFHQNIPDATARAAFRIVGETSLAVRAYKIPGIDFYDAAAIASVTGSGSSWAPSAFTDSFSRNTLWSIGDFDFSTTEIVFNEGGGTRGCSGVGAVLKLKGPRTYRVDLSSIAVGEEFTLNIVARAEAVNRRGGGSAADCEGSSASAFLKDPIEVGGATIAFSDLEPTNRPLASPTRTLAVVPPAACVPGTGTSGGTLQFGTARYAADESQGATVTVRRTGGSSGAATATFTTSDGTAIAGTDYTPVTATVFFADGEDGERAVVIPIVQDVVSGEPDRTVNLTLSQPGGCAVLGPQATAELTITDDDAPPPPPSFTVGGTVSGLVGTGLVLQDLQAQRITPANGAFTFPSPTRTGLEYGVTIVTQPTNPSQVCSVANGNGTVTDANVTNIAVTCVTPAANGALDPSFGAAGKVISAFGGDESAMAVQPDGKIVMVSGASDFTVARYNADGSVDAGFGNNGVVTTDFGSNQDAARAVAIQPDGKIVVAGVAAVGRTSRNLFNFDFAIARYNSDGTLDTSFGSAGKRTTDFNGETDRAFALAIQPDGRIVVVGSVNSRGPVADVVDFGVARYDATGTLDPTFGSGGKVVTDIAGGADIAQNVALQPDGAIVVSGPRTNAGDAGLDHAALVRYNADGSPDTAFGNNGKVVVDNVRAGEALAIQGDGKIVVAGAIAAGAFPANSTQFAVMRFGANGSADTGFGSNGLVSTPFTTQDDVARAVALQADGKIVVAGQSSNRSNPDFAVARYNAHGTLDASFGSGGKLTIDFFGSFDGAESVAVQPNGAIVIGGFARNGTRTGFGVVRVLP